MDFNALLHGAQKSFTWVGHQPLVDALLAQPAGPALSALWTEQVLASFPADPPDMEEGRFDGAPCIARLSLDTAPAALGGLVAQLCERAGWEPPLEAERDAFFEDAAVELEELVDERWAALCEGLDLQVAQWSEDLEEDGPFPYTLCVMLPEHALPRLQRLASDAGMCVRSTGALPAPVRLEAEVDGGGYTQVLLVRLSGEAHAWLLERS